MNKNEFKTARKKIGDSKAKFSRRLGVSKSSITRWESGTRKVPEYIKKFIEYILDSG